MPSPPSLGAVREPHLELRLLGHVALEVDGQPFHLATPRRSLSVLAYLSLNRTTAVQRDFLAYLLWPDEEEDDARQKLRASLHDLLKVLPPAPAGWFVVETDSLRWRPEAHVDVDVESFERFAADGRLEEAVALYRGDLVQTLYDEWIGEPRERLRNLYLAHLDELASRARRARAYGRGIDYAQRILAVDPWREDVLRRIVAMRYESGDAAGALAEFNRFAERLRAEMNVEPMPETLALSEIVLRQGDLPVPGSLESAPPERSRDDAALPLLGRRTEFARLTELWNAAAGGRGAVIFLRGEAGIGKSRLALDFARSVAEGGARTLAGAAGQPEAFPYQPIVEALRGALPLVAALPLDGIARAALAVLLPELRARVGALPELPDLPADGERARLFEYVARVVEALAKPRPLLLILEDVQWAGEATHASIAFLLRRIARMRVLVLVTVRDNELAPGHPVQALRREGAAAGVAHEIALSLLDASDLGVLAERFPNLEPGALATLFERSEGHPLYLAHLLESAAEGTPLPDATLASMLTARLERLAPQTRTLAEIAALVGRRFPAEALGPVTGWNDSDVRAALDELIDARLVRETSGRGIFDFAFSHQLVVEALVDNAPRARDRERNRRIARALERTFVNQSEELAATVARHYVAAGEPTFAAPHYLVACRRALALGALDEAADYAERCIAGTQSARLRADARLELDAVHLRRGDLAARASGLAALGELADELGDDELHCDLADRKRGMAQDGGDYPAEAAQIAAMHERAQRAGSPRWIASAYLGAALATERFYPTDRLLAYAVRAAEGFADVRDVEGQVRALLVAASAAVRLFEIARARELLAAGAALIDGDASYLARVTYERTAANLVPFLGDAAHAEREFRRWVAVANEAGDRLEAAVASEALAWALQHRSRLGESLALMRSSIDFFALHGFVAHLTRARINLSILLARAGALPEAIAVAGQVAGEPIGSERGDAFAARAFAFGIAGELEPARAAAARALEIVERTNNARSRIELLDTMGEIEFAAGAYESAAGRFEETLAAYGDTLHAGGKARARAMLAACALQRGDAAEARRRISELLADPAWRASGTMWPERCDWIAATVHRACGDATAANAALEIAYARMLADEGSLEPAARAPFRELPWNRAIAEAAELGLWPTAAPIDA